MNDPGDPPRWSDTTGGAPPELRELLSNARSDVPGPAALAALGVAVPTLVAESAAAGVATQLGAAAAKTGGAALSAKVGGAATALIVASATVFAVVQAPKKEPAPAPHAVATEAVPSEPPQWEEQPHRTAPEATSPLVDTPVEAEVETEGTSTAQRSPSQGAKPTGGELQLLQRARAVLRTAPTRALELTAQHQREYPSSQFVQERQVIRIEALKRLGREEEARQLGSDFNQRFPDSAHGTRLETENQ